MSFLSFGRMLKRKQKKLKTNCYKQGQKKTGKSLRFPALSKTKPQLMLFIEILEITNKAYCW